MEACWHLRELSSAMHWSMTLTNQDIPPDTDSSCLGGRIGPGPPRAQSSQAKVKMQKHPGEPHLAAKKKPCILRTELGTG